MNAIDWRVWLLTAIARRLGLHLFSLQSAEGGRRGMLFATSRLMARDTAEQFAIAVAIAEYDAARGAYPVVYGTLSDDEVKH